MTSITYINSILDMETPLPRSRLLRVKGDKVRRGLTVTPILTIKKNANLSFMAKAIAQIKIAMKARKVSVPESTAPTSKYKVQIM